MAEHEEEEVSEEIKEYRRRYRRTLKAANKGRGRNADLLLDTTAEDVNWLHSMRDQDERFS